MADLLSHPELDPDSDGSFTEADAQVSTVFRCVVQTSLGNPKADRAIYFIFLQGLLGGVDRVDTTGFESVWSSIKDKYTSQVKAISDTIRRLHE